MKCLAKNVEPEPNQVSKANVNLKKKKKEIEKHYMTEKHYTTPRLSK